MEPTVDPFIRRETAGRGPTLVFTHGYLQTTATTWSRQIEHFAGKAPLVAWNLPGHGRSPKRDGYSLSVVTADLEQILFGTEGDVVLVGHSLGGYASLRRAILDPSRIRGLMLVATGPAFEAKRAVSSGTPTSKLRMESSRALPGTTTRW